MKSESSDQRVLKDLTAILSRGRLDRESREQIERIVTELQDRLAPSRLRWPSTSLVLAAVSLLSAVICLAARILMLWTV